MSGAGVASLGALGIVRLMAKQVRLTLQKAIAKANLRRAEVGEKPITMNSLAVAAGVAATTITRLARHDDKAASALSLDLVICNLFPLFTERLPRLLHLSRISWIASLMSPPLRSSYPFCVS
ncbi:MAG: hypothetical protein EB072_19085 [Betaproteobacteria bacterium]|nr:hypothetical protein [Betaproteobacteria bacterium]